MRIPACVRFSLTCLLALVGAHAASAQCYQFSATPAVYTSGSTGGPANVTMDFTSFPAPTVVGVPGSNNVRYTCLLPGNPAPPLPGSNVSLVIAPHSSYLSELVEL